jgi:hypothetical protein
MIEPSESQRYDALDAVRATAMLLGVFYHSMLFGGMFGGGPPGGFGPPGAPGGQEGFNGSMMMQEWLHSFRMPLFFLISGFFCQMMLGKYGLWSYLVRRWWRIGMPLLIGIFTFVPLYKFSESGFRGGPPMGRFGPPMTTDGARRASTDLNDAASHSTDDLPFDPANLPPPPPGFVPPPLEAFDTNRDGTIDAEEWKIAVKELPPPPSGFGLARIDLPADQDDSTDDDRLKVAGTTAGNVAANTSIDRQIPVPKRPGMSFAGPGRNGPFGPPGAVSSWLFGSSARFFTLSHLWFLWYLLVFASATPLAAKILGWVVFWIKPTTQNTFAGFIVRWQLAPLLLGLLSFPFLLMTRPFFGWTLGLASGIGRGFPDFFWHLESDMPFYFTFFVIGWWLHGRRDELPVVAAGWWFNLAIGLLAHAAAMTLSHKYASQTTLAYYSELRLAGYGLYAIGSAYTAWGFLGVFQRFANHPTAIGRYLADTALWVYLLHQALLFPFLAWLAPFKLVWWINASLASLLTSAAALLVFESLVRPTPLNRLFGPGTSLRRNTNRSIDENNVGIDPECGSCLQTT